MRQVRPTTQDDGRGASRVPIARRLIRVWFRRQFVVREHCGRATMASMGVLREALRQRGIRGQAKVWQAGPRRRMEPGERAITYGHFEVPGTSNISAVFLTDRHYFPMALARDGRYTGLPGVPLSLTLLLASFEDGLGTWGVATRNQYASREDDNPLVVDLYRPRPARNAHMISRAVLDQFQLLAPNAQLLHVETPAGPISAREYTDELREIVFEVYPELRGQWLRAYERAQRTAERRNRGSERGY
jgi:hypothetical protein